MSAWPTSVPPLAPLYPPSVGVPDLIPVPIMAIVASQARTSLLQLHDRSDTTIPWQGVRQLRRHFWQSLAHFSALQSTLHAPHDVLYFDAHRVLIGACNPISCPIPGFRAPQQTAGCTTAGTALSGCGPLCTTATAPRSAAPTGSRAGEAASTNLLPTFPHRVSCGCLNFMSPNARAPLSFSSSEQSIVSVG